jgi:hypothetical protein
MDKNLGSAFPLILPRPIAIAMCKVLMSNAIKNRGFGSTGVRGLGKLSPLIQKTLKQSYVFELRRRIYSTTSQYLRWQIKILPPLKGAECLHRARAQPRSKAPHTSSRTPYLTPSAALNICYMQGKCCF